MRVGTLEEIWRYPVKSMQGELLARAELTEGGIAGDRGVAVLDASSGHAISGKRIERLVTARATSQEIHLPDGRAVPIDAADELLSDWLGRPVRVAEPTPSRRPTIDSEGGRTFDGGRPGAFFDSSPLHLVTSSTLDHLAGLYDGVFDRRRFRPNLFVRAEPAGPIERSWVGRKLRVGDAVLSIERGCSRCIMTTSEQDDLPKDRGILKTVAREEGNIVGVLLTVDRPGAIGVGDPVDLLP